MTSYSDTLQHGDSISCYQIDEILGRGGFAVTYLATDINLDVQVAIKEYLPTEIIQRDEHNNVSARRAEFAEDYDIGLNSFAREAKTLARFKHPNIVRVHQVIHHNNTAYMVMDYEHGQELTDVLQHHDHLSEVDLRAMIFPIFDGVEEIHRHGLAHRDIKPSNIYLRDNGSPVLLDFGAARYTMSETTQQLTAVVTVGYTPIEQYNVSNSDQGPWSDIYALAAVLYEAITGEMPIDSVTRASSTLTRAEDPLLSVRQKARKPCSDYFLDAIDWGLRMEAGDRPQSIAQWRDAFDGIQPDNSKARTNDRKDPKPVVRRSKLRTYADNPNIARGEPHKTRVNPARATTLAASAPHTRIDARRDPHIGDDLESIPLNEQRNPGHSGTPIISFDGGSPAHNNAEPNQNVTPRSGPVSTRLPNDSSHENTPNGSASGKRTEPATQSTRQSSDGTSHTQEIRNVLRRDIMKRDPDAQTQSPHDNLPVPPPPPYRRQLPNRGAQNDASGQTDQPQFNPQLAPRENHTRDDMPFDESDWDYEAPTQPSAWRWVIPAMGMAAVVAGSYWFVNQGTFSLNNTGPDMTLETALSQAQNKVTQNSLIFPAGESALDYYHLILASDPQNPQAITGIKMIQATVLQQIVEQVDANNLSEANRILSRANNAGLQIDSLPAGQDSAAVVTGATSGVLAIDTTLSPYLQNKIQEIETLLSEKKFEEADALFTETDRYLPDVNLSKSLRARINSRDAAMAYPQTSADDLSSRFNGSLPLPDLEPEFSNVAELTGINSSAADDSDIQSSSLTHYSITDDTLFTGKNTGTAVETGRESPVPNLIDANVQIIEADAPASVSDVKLAAVSTTEEAPRQSAPRRSFIAGSGSIARHLNQLRSAIEGKNLNQVLVVSDNLPAERTDFLRRMFRRYDRLDVSIDNIVNSSETATARLNVSMFNQRSDGSYYSAGKWNGVTLKASQDDGEWQKISW